MSRRELSSINKNPPRSIGTVFDAMRNASHGFRGNANKGANLAHVKARESRMKDALSVDLSKPYRAKGA